LRWIVIDADSAEALVGSY